MSKINTGVFLETGELTVLSWVVSVAGIGPGNGNLSASTFPMRSAFSFGDLTQTPSLHWSGGMPFEERVFSNNEENSFHHCFGFSDNELIFTFVRITYLP